MVSGLPEGAVAGVASPSELTAGCDGGVSRESFQSLTSAFDTTHLELVRFISTTIALDIENVRLHRFAVTDPLTGAFNREFLMQRLPAELQDSLDRG